MRTLLLALACAFVACGDSKKDEPVARGAVARFELGPSPLRFAAVPFPSDLYLGSDGTIDLASPPQVVEDEPVWHAIVGELNKRRGFCTTCNVYFPIEGTLARPRSAGPHDTAGANDPVVMIGPDSKPIPLQFEWNDDDKLLAVRPVPWVVLKRNTKYIVALTSRLKDVDGIPLRASRGFARDHEHVASALDALAAAGVPRADVVSVAAFTTEDPTADPIAARKLVTSAAATLTKVWPNPTESLDDLFGVPVDALPGLRPPKDPSLGKQAANHEHIAYVVYGSYQGPHVRDGDPRDGGFPVRDNKGELTANGTEPVPFLLTIPKTGDLAKLPVVIVATGASSSAALGLAPANAFASVGVATLAIDPPCQGARARGAVDKRNDFRDAAVLDGIPDADNTEGVLRCLGVVGPPAGKKGSPFYLRGFGLQLESDLFTAVRLAKSGDWTAIKKDALTTLAFDPANIFLLGNHGSAIQATAVAAVETDVAGVIANAFVASIAEGMMEAPGGRFIAANILAPLALRRDLDEVNRRYTFHPALDLYRWASEAAEARSMLPYVYADPIAPGPRPDLLLQRPALDEFVTDEQMAAAAATLGIPSNVDIPFAPLTITPAPMSANVDTKSGKVTAGVSVFGDGLARMIFLPAEDSSFEPPFNPPAKQRPMPLSLPNPVAAVHAQFAAFVKARIEKGRAEIIPPK